MRGRGTRTLATVAAGLSTPALGAWAFATAVHPRLRRDWAERWGLRVPAVSPGAVWVHAASLGEVAAATALLPHLDAPLLLTTDTDTGAARARALGVAACVRPVDHPWTLAPLWAEARPRALVFVESAFWPQLAARAARDGVPVLRAGGRPGRGTRRWGLAWRVVTDGTDAIAARDADSAAWYRARGAGPVVVTGDLKGDQPLPASPLRWSRPVVVGASTREGDEARLLAATPDAALLLAPRHPERFEAVARLLERAGVRWARRTALDDEVPVDVDVVLLDTLGELAGCLAAADAAFIGGTFDPTIGGQSPAEAVRAGVPVVRGPHVGANAAAYQGAVVHEAGDDLASALGRALADRGTPRANGAGERTARALAPWLGGPPAPEASPRPWARPLVPAWRWATHARHALRGGAGPAIPTVCVGSDNARGPGRTSTARWVAAALRQRGHTVGVAVRGYRRTAGGRRVAMAKDASVLGDEGGLFAADGFLVAACPDLGRAVAALSDAGVTVVVVDDGLGWPSLRRGLDLRVVDLRFPGGGGPLPAGWQRPDTGPVRGLIAHHAGAPGACAPPPGAAIATRVPGPWHRGQRQVQPPERVAAVLGVARPADVVASWGVAVDRVWVLRDHQAVDARLGAALERFAGDLPLACTAKDRQRLPADLRDRVLWRDLTLQVRGVPEWWFPEAPA